MKVAYGLTADQAEADALRGMLAAPTNPDVPPTTAPPVSSQPQLALSPTSAGSSFASCAAARAAGKAPMRQGDAGYRPGLDGDRVICTA